MGPGRNAKTREKGGHGNDTGCTHSPAEATSLHSSGCWWLKLEGETRALSPIMSVILDPRVTQLPPSPAKHYFLGGSAHISQQVPGLPLVLHIKPVPGPTWIYHCPKWPLWPLWRPTNIYFPKILSPKSPTMPSFLRSS